MKSLFNLIRVFFFGKKDEEAELEFEIEFEDYELIAFLVLIGFLVYRCVR